MSTVVNQMLIPRDRASITLFDVAVTACPSIASSLTVEDQACVDCSKNGNRKLE